jgi:hypothetical protein
MRWNVPDGCSHSDSELATAIESDRYSQWAQMVICQPDNIIAGRLKREACVATLKYKKGFIRLKPAFKVELNRAAAT